MKNIKDEKVIQEKVDQFMGCIEKVLSTETSNKTSYVWLNKNKNNQPELSKRLKGNEDLVIDLGEINYLTFCKTFFKSVIDKYLTSETIGFSPNMNQVWVDGVDTWSGYPMHLENIETGNKIKVCFQYNNEIDNAINYFKTLYEESTIEQ